MLALNKFSKNVIIKNYDGDGYEGIFASDNQDIDALGSSGKCGYFALDTNCLVQSPNTHEKKANM